MRSLLSVSKTRSGEVGQGKVSHGVGGGEQKRRSRDRANGRASVILAAHHPVFKRPWRAIERVSPSLQSPALRRAAGIAVMQAADQRYAHDATALRWLDLARHGRIIVERLMKTSPCRHVQPPTVIWDSTISEIAFLPASGSLPHAAITRCKSASSDARP